MELETFEKASKLLSEISSINTSLDRLKSSESLKIGSSEFIRSRSDVEAAVVDSCKEVAFEMLSSLLLEKRKAFKKL